MSCLSWNCHGLRNPQTEAELADLVGKKDPKVVFLMETKVDKEVIERISRKMQYNFFFLVPRHNRGGGAGFSVERGFCNESPYFFR